MQNVQLKPYVAPDVADRIKTIGEHHGMSGNQLAAMILTEISRVRKEALFAALASVPQDLKTRPVGRPAGTAARKEESHHATAAVA